MSNLFFVVVLALGAATMGDDPGGGDGDCKAALVYEGVGNEYTGPGDEVIGYGNVDGECCSDAKYCYFIENTSGATVSYELRVRQSCGGVTSTQTTSRTTLQPGRTDVMCFSPPENNCDCTYTLDLYSNETGLWLILLDGINDVRATIHCETVCSDE